MEGNEEGRRVNQIKTDSVMCVQMQKFLSLNLLIAFFLIYFFLIKTETQGMNGIQTKEKIAFDFMLLLWAYSYFDVANILMLINSCCYFKK